MTTQKIQRYQDTHIHLYIKRQKLSPAVRNTQKKTNYKYITIDLLRHNRYTKRQKHSYTSENTKKNKNTHIQIYNTKSKNTHIHLYLKRQKQPSTVKETQQPQTTNTLFYIHDKTTDTASNIKHSYTFMSYTTTKKETKTLIYSS